MHLRECSTACRYNAPPGDRPSRYEACHYRRVTGIKDRRDAESVAAAAAGLDYLSRVPVVRARPADRGLRGARWHRRRSYEGAAMGTGFDSLVQGTALHIGRPGQEPLGPAVVPDASPRRTGNGHGVARHLDLVIGLGGGWWHVDAAVAHVGEA